MIDKNDDRWKSLNIKKEMFELLKLLTNATEKTKLNYRTAIFHANDMYDCGKNTLSVSLLVIMVK